MHRKDGTDGLELFHQIKQIVSDVNDVSTLHAFTNFGAQGVWPAVVTTGVTTVSTGLRA